MNPIKEKREKRKYLLQQKEELMHMKRMLYLEEAKKQYLQTNTNALLDQFATS